jgi:ABC-2 type transport system permease protein
VRTLVKVELTRMLWRRAVVVLLLLAVVLPLAVFVIRVLDTRTQSLEDLVAENGTYVVDEVDSCVRRPRQYLEGPDTDDVQSACEELIAGWYGNSPLDLVDEREEGGAIAAILLVSMVLLLAGTTFAGHDWNTGSMSNQLLFEPRRQRVWLAKALAVGMLTGALALAVLVAYWTGMWATASIRDLPIQEHAVAAAYKQAVLGAGFAAGAAVFGYALTMLLRSTVGTLGTLFAVGFFCVAIVAGVLGLPGGLERVMPWGNFYAYAVGSYEYYDYGGCMFAEGGECGQDTIERGASIVYFTVIWVAVAAASLLSYRRRDVP